MAWRPGLGHPYASELMLVANDPRVVAATEAAALHLGKAPPHRVASGAEAMARLVGPGIAPAYLVCEPAAVGQVWPRLLAAAMDPFSATDLIVVGDVPGPLPRGFEALPPEPARLAAALAVQRQAGNIRGMSDPTALADGLSRDEILVRFQPVVRVRDRQPVMVEALARWQRPDAAILGASRFVPLAERSGLAAALTASVARRALTELASVRRAMPPLRLSINVPLTELLRPQFGGWLRRLAVGSGLCPSNLLLELTESTAVRDRAALARALGQLGNAGFGVLMDDLALDDRRAALLDLPFAGVKLDRSFVAALATHRRARGQAMRLVAQAHARGMRVVAEGITGRDTWHVVAGLGIDEAQGFGIGRPMPADALPGWRLGWAAAAAGRYPLNRRGRGPTLR